MKWSLVWQILLLMFALYCVLQGLIKVYFNQRMTYETVSRRMRQEDESAPTVLYQGDAPQ